MSNARVSAKADRIAIRKQLRPPSIFPRALGGFVAICFCLVGPATGQRQLSTVENKKSDRAAEALEKSVQAEAEFSGAIDLNGNRHRSRDYHPKTAPWMEDHRHAVPPWYPYYDRKERHEGVGFFRLYLSLRTGAVNRIEMVKSTGYDSLDQAALKALRQWTWKPGRWKQIDLPVRFTMSRRFRGPIMFEQPARIR